MRKQNGITLVALIITIIVLLIIAGVTIASMMNEENIINKSKQARDNYAANKQYEESKLLEYDGIMTNIIMNSGF